MPRVLVAPVTRRMRVMPSALPLGVDEGIPVDSAAAFDTIRLGGASRHELRAVVAATLDC